MTRILGFVLSICLFLTSNGFGSAEISLMTQLSPSEAQSAQAFQNETLWVGRNRNRGMIEYSLEAYNNQGTLIDLVGTYHSNDTIYPLGTDKVVVIGRRVKDNGTFSYYSVFTLAGQKIRLLERKEFSLRVSVQNFAGTESKMYFSAPGGAYSSSNTGNSDGNKSIFTLGSFGMDFLKQKFAYVSSINQIGNLLFATETTLASHNDGLLAIDLKSQKATEVFPMGAYQDIGTPTIFDAHTLAVPVKGSREVILVDTNLKTVRSIKMNEGTPTVARRLGNCIVAALKDTREVIFIDLKTEKRIGHWDFSTLGGQFTTIHNMDLSPSSGRVFVRSALPLPWGSVFNPDRNAVAVGYEKDDAVFKACRL